MKFLPVLLLLPVVTWAQGTVTDYQRFNEWEKRTAGKVLNARVKPHWIDGGDRFWYRRDLAGGKKEYVLVDAVRGTRETGYKPPAAEASLTPSGTEQRSKNSNESTFITFANQTNGPVDLLWIDTEGDHHSYGTLPPGASRRQQTYAGHVWLAADAAKHTLAVFTATDEESTAVISDKTPPPHPDAAPGKVPDRDSQEVIVRGHNLCLRDRKTGTTLPLTTDGTAKDGYNRRFHWSPDRQRLVAMRTRQGNRRKVTVVESSPADQVQPKVHSFDYAKPGDAIPISKPHLFDIAARKEIPVADTLFPNPWSIDDIRWMPDSKRFAFVYNQRGHQVLRVVAVDAGTGAAQALVEETSPTFIDYAGKYFLHWLDATGELIWMSERDGWNHLYLYDTRDGRVKNQITRGEWVVREVDRVDEEKREVWFQAGGIRPGQDPYQIHHCRVRFDGTGLVVLTEGDGTHSADFSPDRRFLVDTWSRPDLPPVSELRRADTGALVCPLEKADDSALRETGWRAPERFCAKGRDGTTDIYGVICRPSNFDPAKKYPVIEDIYAGPQDIHVPKSFHASDSAQALAELGFVVVKIDGMGTSHRSKKFHDVCWKNIADAGFPDRILWLRAAAAHDPALDLGRVGIYGTSAGGQNAVGALLTHGDFYKVAVADCGCHDNRMDKIWWNELWMGWPVGNEYAEQSNVTLAPKLTGHLLLAVGELDHNVDPASTMQVANALIRANKDFDLLVVPGAGHGVIGSPYGRRRLADFFVRHLLGVEPRRE